MSNGVTTNYSFKKRQLGHPIRDNDIGENLDLIDLAIKTRADAITELADASANQAVSIASLQDASANHAIAISNLGDASANKETRLAAVESYMKVASGVLVADVSGNMAFWWQNPETAKILIHRILIDRTTAGGTANSVLDVGVIDASGNNADNLIDGLNLNTTGLADNIEDKGSNGKSRQKLDENGDATDWITGKILVADALSLVGKYYIFYTKVAG